MKKLYLAIIFALILVLPMIYADELTIPTGLKDDGGLTQIDNIKSVDMEKMSAGYPEVTIKNSILWIIPLDPIARFSILDNTEVCGTECYTVGKVTLYKNSQLFSGAEFKDLIKRQNTELSSYKLYVRGKTTYTEECYNSVNGTKICEQTKNEEEWVDYNNEVLYAGDYEWKLTGEKGFYESIDAIPISNGIKLYEYANWGAGGTMTQYLDGTTNYTVHTFLASGDKLQLFAMTNLTVLVIGGGGSGASGGGGAGGVTYTTLNNTAIGNYSVTIGAGGIPAGTSGTIGGAGGQTILATLVTVDGGGAGGAGGVGNTNPGGNGGSGGGGGGESGMVHPGGDSTVGQGFSGGSNRGDTNDPFPAGGGGGAGQGGYNSTTGTAGNGGNGIQVNINGTLTYFAGGGGGATFTGGGTVGTGGLGGGGDASASATGSNGRANSGGGAGGAKTGQAGGTGGTGIVIIRYVNQIEESRIATALQSFPANGFATLSNTVNLGCNFTGNLYNNISSIRVAVYSSGDLLTYGDTVTGLNAISYNKTNWVTSALIEDTYKWACYMNGDGGLNASTGNLTFSVDSTLPTINIITPTGNQGIQSIPYNITLNYTASDLNLQTCWWNATFSTAINLTTCNSTVVISVPNGNTNRIYVYANDSLGNSAVNWSEFYPSLSVNSVSYNPTTTAGTTETFSINYNYSASSYSGIGVMLNYNNTNYSMANTVTGDNGIATTSITIPIVSSITDKQFYFIFALTNGGTTYYNTGLYNQTISAFLVDNCTSFGKKVLTFDMVDEETQPNFQRINGTINFLASFYNVDRTLLLNTYNTTWTFSSPVSVCLANISNAYSLDWTAQYSGNISLYFTKYKTIQNFALSNASLNNNYTLYNLLYNSGNTFQIIVSGAPMADNSNLVIDTQKEYLGLNSFYSVEAPLTDDYGNAIGHLTTGSATYTFVISRNGVVLGTFNNNKVKCNNAATGDCVVQLNLASATTNIPDFTNYGNISSVYTLNQNTSVLYYTYTTTDGQAKNLVINVIANDNFDNTTICNQSTYGGSGTIICVIPTPYLNTTFYALAYADGKYLGTTYFSLGSSPNWYGADIFIEILLYTSLVFLFASSPILIIIGAVLGFVLSFSLIMISGGTWMSIIGVCGFFIAAGVIVIIRMRRTING